MRDELQIYRSFALIVVSITTTMTDISAVDGCDADGTITITITIIIIAVSVCSINRTIVIVTSMRIMVVITTG